jgi:hypothetical protein
MASSSRAKAQSSSGQRTIVRNRGRRTLYPRACTSTFVSFRSRLPDLFAVGGCAGRDQLSARQAAHQHDQAKGIAAASLDLTRDIGRGMVDCLAHLLTDVDGLTMCSRGVSDCCVYQRRKKERIEYYFLSGAESNRPFLRYPAEAGHQSPVVVERLPTGGSRRAHY